MQNMLYAFKPRIKQASHSREWKQLIKKFNKFLDTTNFNKHTGLFFLKD